MLWASWFLSANSATRPSPTCQGLLPPGLHQFIPGWQDPLPSPHTPTGLPASSLVHSPFTSWLLQVGFMSLALDLFS